jgi:predicted ATP-dependent serine protease
MVLDSSSSIKGNQDFKRSNILCEINNEQSHLLILGESGTSKSTILMETICHYFERGYEILYNYGNVDITNVEQQLNHIED